MKVEEEAQTSEKPAFWDEIDLSILIVNWNSGDFLCLCLESLEAQKEEGFRFEVIVVDNASMDGSLNRAIERFPWAKYICNTYNYGFAKATNQAYRLSKGRYVMTLNPDAYFSPGALREIVQFLDNTPDAGLVQPYLPYNHNRYLKYNKLTKIMLFEVLCFKLNPPPIPKPIEKPLAVQWIWETGIVARRSILDKDIFYSEWVFLFCEEYDLCKLISQKGYKLYALPINMDHFQGGSRNRSLEIRYITTKLSHAATYMMDCKELGVLRARFNTLIRFIDGFILWIIQIIIQSIRPKYKRLSAILEWKAAWNANLALLLRGSSYFYHINQETEKLLNNQDLIRRSLYPLPEEDSLSIKSSSKVRQ